MLSVVAKALVELKDRVVFLGGATVDIYIDDPAAPPLRVTDDVDCVAEIASLQDYHRLGERLQALGFSHPLGENDPPICRWKLGATKVDVMATGEDVFGFGNRWFQRGMETAEQVRLPDGTTIAVFGLPFFLASKIEAFQGRGGGDLYSSADLEDIIAVLDGCRAVKTELDKAPQDVKEYLQARFRQFLQIEDFTSVVGGHPGDEGSLAAGRRAERIIALLREFAGRP